MGKGKSSGNPIYPSSIRNSEWRFKWKKSCKIPWKGRPFNQLGTRVNLRNWENCRFPETVFYQFCSSNNNVSRKFRFVNSPCKDKQQTHQLRTVERLIEARNSASDSQKNKTQRLSSHWLSCRIQKLRKTFSVFCNGAHYITTWSLFKRSRANILSLN